MKVVPRKDLDKDLLMPYRHIYLSDVGTWVGIEGANDGYIPSEAYPLTVKHTDDNGNVLLLLDETDDNSTIIANSIDFEFISDDKTEPNTDFFEDLELLLTKHFDVDWTWRYKDASHPLMIYSESLANQWDKMVEAEIAKEWENDDAI